MDSGMAGGIAAGEESGAGRPVGFSARDDPFIGDRWTDGEEPEAVWIGEFGVEMTGEHGCFLDVADDKDNGGGKGKPGASVKAAAKAQRRVFEWLNHHKSRENICGYGVEDLTSQELAQRKMDALCEDPPVWVIEHPEDAKEYAESLDDREWLVERGMGNDEPPPDPSQRELKEVKDAWGDWEKVVKSSREEWIQEAKAQRVHTDRGREFYKQSLRSGRLRLSSLRISFVALPDAD
ncbi:hypothetical protein AK812_SmicGene10404 [Symbiodinium microadriaticum]|uniref:Uncharacterized protein n=1 Tax=Symbiodinium microadriaticum TaxID=2951 RepID=A0A1Q9EG00_SYMMI|nr:hypothetical protein AK812_SmicGene10404 [Symbiodinium microadriaticum]